MSDPASFNRPAVIPEKYWQGLREGRLVLDGVNLRDRSGRFQGRLAIRSGEVLDSLSKTHPQLQGLAIATTALQGLNLVVSAAGFTAIACKLGEMHQDLRRVLNELDTVNSKLDGIGAGVEQISVHLTNEVEIEREAALENLDRALRIQDVRLALDAVGSLTKSRRMAQRVVERLLSDPQAVYHAPDPFRFAMATALATGIAQARALGLVGLQLESARLVDELLAWHAEQLSVLEEPIQAKSPPLWIGRLRPESRRSAKQLLQLQRALPVALEDLREQALFCHQEDIALASISDHAGDDVLLLQSRETRTSLSALKELDNRPR